MDFEKLELCTETLRELTPGELEQVGGGPQTITQVVTSLVPSGVTWLKDCDGPFTTLTGCYTC